MTRLTTARLAALCACVNERLSGSPEDWRDALGLTRKEAEKSFADLRAASEWIAEEMERREQRRNGKGVEA